MRILFCDDNPVILKQLQSYVYEYFTQHGCKIPEFASYDSGEVLLQNEQQADIAFLDVEMPGVSGIHVGKMLKNKNPKIKIFIVTSFPDYLDEAMRFQVFRYLSKPIDKNRLFRNLKDALYQYSMESKVFPIVTMDGIYTRHSEEIICIEAVSRKVIVHTTTGNLFSVEPLAYWRKVLSLPCFFESHRSFIVNMRFVHTIEKDKIILKWKSISLEAYLTRRKYTTFKHTYLLFMESIK